VCINKTRTSSVPISRYISSQVDLRPRKTDPLTISAALRALSAAQCRGVGNGFIVMLMAAVSAIAKYESSGLIYHQL